MHAEDKRYGPTHCYGGETAFPMSAKEQLDGLCGLVAVFPQEGVADPLAELWTKEAILNLLLNDIV